MKKINAFVVIFLFIGCFICSTLTSNSYNGKSELKLFTKKPNILLILTDNEDDNYRGLKPDASHFYGFDFVPPLLSDKEFEEVADRGVMTLTHKTLNFRFYWMETINKKFIIKFLYGLFNIKYFS